jgi:hypothetical protein
MDYSYQTEIEWEKDPSDLPYLQQFTIHTRKKNGLPQRIRDDYIVYGWANVSDEGPTLRDGTRKKRYFVLKPHDIGAPEEDGSFHEGKYPVEAVTPESITAGEEPNRV